MVYDVRTMRERFSELDERANEPLGSYDESTLGIGHFVSGSSPWERHLNGDELLYVTDGSVSIEVLEGDGSSTILVYCNRYNFTYSLMCDKMFDVEAEESRIESRRRSARAVRGRSSNA